MSFSDGGSVQKFGISGEDLGVSPQMGEGRNAPPPHPAETRVITCYVLFRLGI